MANFLSFMFLEIELSSGIFKFSSQTLEKQENIAIMWITSDPLHISECWHAIVRPIRSAFTVV